MAKVDTMINKKNFKPFKKIAYKPWESSFLNENISAEEINPPSDMNAKNPQSDNLENESCINLVCEQVKQENELNSIYGEETRDYASSYRKSGYVGSSHLDKKIGGLNKSGAVEVPDLEIQKIKSKRIFRVKSLTGINKSIMFELCQRESYRDNNFFYCDIITTGELVDILQSKRSSISTSIERLKSKGYLYLADGKRGKGGYSVYAIPLVIFMEIEKWKSQNPQ